MSLDNASEVWCGKFYEVGEILSKLYTEVLKGDGGGVAIDLVRFITDSEKTQRYPWVYIDYGFRVPIYRTVQWLSFTGFTISKDIGKQVEMREFMDYLYIHLLKEYVLTWSKVMDNIASRDEILNGIIKDVLKLSEEPRDIDPGAFKDIKGIAAELKACYVLIDHWKPFLPFSIMQSPMIPSHIRPGLASGDFYLFEEDLVVDVKSGQLDKETGLPTYYYSRKSNLSSDLGKISDIHKLYGIRKGIGVVAEDEKYIYLAVYVPWRRWRVQGPLLRLKSPKLPLLIYMNNIRESGVAPHKAATIKDSELTIIITVYDLREKLEEVRDEDVALKLLRDDIELKGEIAKNGRILIMKFSTDVSKTGKSIISVNTNNTKRSILLAKLFIKQREKGSMRKEDSLEYPVVATIDKI